MMSKNKMQRLVDKAVAEAFVKCAGESGIPLDEVTSNDMFLKLNPNLRKRVRKETLQRAFARHKEKLFGGESSPAAPSSQSSSASEEFTPADLQEDTSRAGAVGNIKIPAVKRINKRTEPNETREGSRRTIKKRQVFDPSDLGTRPIINNKPKKEGVTDGSRPVAVAHEAVKDPSPPPAPRPQPPRRSSVAAIAPTVKVVNVNACKVCSEDLAVAPPDTKPLEPQTCAGCAKWRAHGACVAWEAQPWRCENCRQCSVCHGKRLPRGEPMVVCKICKESVHQLCASVPKSKADDWYCSSCKDAFREDSSQKDEDFDNPDEDMDDEEISPEPEPEPFKAISRRTSTAQKDGKDSDRDEDDEGEGLGEIPDCSEWTPEQVHSYFQMFVPSQDAQVFLDQEIDGRSLQLLQRGDIITNFNLKIGPALKVYAQVKRLQERSWNIQLCWP